MATILLLGHDAALLEGLAQTLAAVGHKPVLAGSVGEAQDILGSETPLVAVVDRQIAKSSGDALRVPLLPGGAVVLYRSLSDVGGLLPPALQRMTLADLTLPLERQRLVALVQHVESRANHTGRARRTTPTGGPRADESPDPRS